MTKHEKVPETKDVKPNREQRRHPEKFERPENEPIGRDRPDWSDQDVRSAREELAGTARRPPTSGTSRPENVHRQKLADRLDEARNNHLRTVGVRSSLFRLMR